MLFLKTIVVFKFLLFYNHRGVVTCFTTILNSWYRVANNLNKERDVVDGWAP